MGIEVPPFNEWQQYFVGNVTDECLHYFTPVYHVTDDMKLALQWPLANFGT